MIAIPGFESGAIIFEDARKFICHALRQEDGQAVILKVVSGDYTDSTEAIKLRREFELLSKLDISGVPKVLDIREFEGGIAMVMADIGGVALSGQAGEGAMDLEAFLTLGSRLAEILMELHRAQVIHKDIKPDNIILNPETGEVQLIDFGIAVLLSQETVGVVSHRELEGSLPYLSPEQTGRMNRSLDYRTDFYSLGIVFYQLLTGRLPFESDDPAELIHAHLARNPAPLTELNPDVPPVLEAIVLKLMEKSADRRYQSAGGLKADLDRCYRLLKDEGQVRSFEIATSDVSGRFRIPQKLYGREQELRFLLDSFDEVGQGFSECLLVSGYSGIGKSALIQEVHKPVVSRRGYYTSGKFDQFNRDAPYSAVIAAFRGLFRQILSESDERVAQWKADLLEALGANGQIVIDVIPEVQLITGPQPEVVTLPPSEAQNRFNLVFLRFVQVLATEQHPLVLFLDDLQWADTPSLKLIELLLSDPESAYLLIIGAYRDNEVDPTHPLMKTTRALKELQDVVREVTLKPLQIEELDHIVADTLNCPPKEARELAQLLESKTGGNPFFVNEFLKALHADHLVSFNHDRNRWDWDIGRIQERNITDNMAELMRDKIRVLGEQTQQLCQYAACIGNQFDLVTLATVWEKSPQMTAKALWPAIQEGLIVPVGNTYKLAEVSAGTGKSLNSRYRFLHDQVQNAAYVQLDETARREIHLKIGRLLLGSFDDAEKNERIFELITHFNMGAALIGSEEERIAVAILNLQAGKKAKNASAYEPAYRYLMAGIHLLPRDSWQEHYQLSLDLYTEAAESAYLSSQVEEMERLASVVFDKAVALLHKVKAYTVKIQGYISLTRNEEALNTSLEILKLLGVNFPKKPGKLHIISSLIGTKLRLRGKTADQLVDLPVMTDPVQSAVMELLPYTASASYFAAPNLFPLVVFKQINLSVRYGNHVQSTFAYATYGLVMCGSTLEFDEGLKFGEIAVRLLEKFKDVTTFCKVYFLNSGFIRVWRGHFRDTVEGLYNAYQKGLETGDFLFASYAIFNAGSTKFYMGMPLVALKDELDAYAAALLKIKQNTGLTWLNIQRQAIANLIQDGEAEPRLLGPAYDERIQVEQHLKGKDYSGLCVYYMIRMKLDYFFEETESAVANGELCFKYIESVLATPHVYLMYFYYALSLIRSAETASGGKKRRALRQARKLLGTIRKFAKSNPANALSKQYLVEAELARVQNRAQEALSLYEKAIAASRENEFLNDEALANELLGRYWVMRGDTGKGKPYLLESRRLFHKWGAIAKANWLDRRYGLKVETSAAPASGDGTVTRSGSHSGSDIDMLSLMKAALAISGEIQIDKLMSQLMHVLVENAGAQHGFFAIEREGRWMVEASNATGEANTQSWSAVPLQGNPYFPETVAQFVIRTKEDLVLSNAQQDNRFMNDPIVRKKQLRSILCLPIMHQGRLIGILYADNNLNSGVFTEQRVQFLKLLSGQIAVSLENALQYEHLEQIVADRTAEVMRQRDALEKSLGDLKLAQAKLVESEKMASLGQLTAGLAHEINNPINFVSVGVNNLQQNFEELKTALEAYLALDPAEDNREALKKIADKNLHQLVEETVEDSDEMFRSIQNGIKRTVTIVKSLRNFSRLDEGEYKVVDIHEGLDSTLEILQSQIRKKAEIVREYGELPPIECAAGKINQVFMNIINNALQAIDGTGTITLATRYDKSQSEIRIAISDTGSGMTEEVKRRLFEPFFTTKPVGEGTGLGMSISYGIINDHKGRIEVESEVGKGSTFVIYLPVKQA